MYQQVKGLILPYLCSDEAVISPVGTSVVPNIVFG